MAAMTSHANHDARDVLKDLAKPSHLFRPGHYALLELWEREQVSSNAVRVNIFQLTPAVSDYQKISVKLLLSIAFS